MNKGLERMIEKDLHMEADAIRRSSWDDLLKRHNTFKKPFRPQNLFFTSGNIYLAQNRTMKMHAVNVRNVFRKGLCEIKCLMKCNKMK